MVYLKDYIIMNLANVFFLIITYESTVQFLNKTVL